MYENQVEKNYAGSNEAVETERPGEIKSEISRLSADVSELNALVSKLHGQVFYF